MRGILCLRSFMLAWLVMPSACGPAERAKPGAPAEQAKPGEPAEQTLSADAAAQARRTIMRWLECEECTDGEVDSVVRLGAVAVPSLSAALLDGPSPVRLEEQKYYLRESYRQQREYGRSHPAAAPRMTEAEHLALYTRNLIGLYRVRSAIALERIGGADAAEALDKAVRLELPADERAVVQAAAKRVRR
jgi:hypothetical protein